VKRQRVFWICLAVLMMFAGTKCYAQAKDEVAVSVNPPDEVEVGNDFTVTLDISEVTELNAVQYDISFDPGVLRLDTVTPGLIDSKTISAWFSEINPGVFRIVQTLLTKKVSGSGFLATLHFHSLNTSCGSYIGISNGILSGMEGELPSIWTGSQVTITGEDIVCIELEQGWNLVSMPWYIESGNRASTDLLADIMDTLDGVYQFDRCTNDWEAFFPSNMNNPPSSLQNMRDGPGYWFYMNAADELYVKGNILPSNGISPEYPVDCTGWHLVGPRIGKNQITLGTWLSSCTATRGSTVLGYDKGAWIVVDT
jgi:hypothetical protein